MPILTTARTAAFIPTKNVSKADKKHLKYKLGISLVLNIVRHKTVPLISSVKCIQRLNEGSEFLFLNIEAYASLNLLCLNG